jgi:hypothetical protein
MLSNANECVGEIAAFLQAFGFERWLVGAWKYAAMRAGFLSSLFGGNITNSATTCQRAIFCFLIFKFSTKMLSERNFYTGIQLLIAQKTYTYSTDMGCINAV